MKQRAGGETFLVKMAELRLNRNARLFLRWPDSSFGYEDGQVNKDPFSQMLFIQEKEKIDAMLVPAPQSLHLGPIIDDARKQTDINLTLNPGIN